MVGVFLAASLLTIWRLESMSAGGLEGTVIGTLVTPYLTGLGNLFFAYDMLEKKNGASEVMTNCLVNNVTNMTLVLGLPALIWGLNLFPSKSSGKKKPARAKKSSPSGELNRLSLLLTLTAIYGAAGIGLCLRLKILLRDWQTLSASLDQLRKDRLDLEKILI